MIRCNNCGTLNEDNASFCTSCGRKLDAGIHTYDPAVKPEKKITADKNTSKPIYAKWGFWAVIVAIIIGVVFMVNKPNPASYIQASSKQEPFLRTGGTYDMDIDTDGDWEISFCSDWIKAVPTEKGLRITCSVNDTGENRNGWITLSSGKTHVRIDVLQNGFASFLKTDKSHIDVGKAGGTYTFFVRTDGSNYDVLYPNYCSVDKNAASFSITIPENTGYDRSDNIIVKADQQELNLTFSQKGICLLCNGCKKVSCGKCGGTGQAVTSFDIFGNAVTEQCPDCEGSGKIDCPRCGGTGSN